MCEISSGERSVITEARRDFVRKFVTNIRRRLIHRALSKTIRPIYQLSHFDGLRNFFPEGLLFVFLTT